MQYKFISIIYVKIKKIEAKNITVIKISSKKPNKVNKVNRNRSSRSEVFCKKGVLRNFAKFTGSHRCPSLFFNIVAARACNFIKKETLAQVFFCEFCEFSKNFFTKHLWATLLKLHFGMGVL